MENETGFMTNCKEGEHLMKVWLCEEKPKENSYYMGVCMSCGLTEVLHVKQLEEIFSN